MPVVAFDTHKFIRKLAQSGMSESQAEAIADAFKEVNQETEFVTKRDLKDTETLLKQDIETVRSELSHDIKAVRSDLNEQGLKFQSELANSKSDMIKWFVALSLSQTGLLVAILFKLFS